MTTKDAGARPANLAAEPAVSQEERQALADLIRTRLTSRSTTSAECKDTVVEARIQVISLKAQAEAANARALNPRTPQEDVAEARRAAGEAEADVQRLKVGIVELEAHGGTLAAREKEAAAKAEYAAARAERDALAAEYAAKVPDALECLVDLIKRIDASDQRCGAITTGRTGDDWLSSAEAVARGVFGGTSPPPSQHAGAKGAVGVELRQFMTTAGIQPVRLRQLRIPDTRKGGSQNLLWPPRSYTA